VAAIVGAFLTMALFLGLVPTVLAAVFGVGTPITGGIAASVTFTAASVAVVASSRIHPHQLRLLGSITLTVAALFFISSIGTHALPLLWVAAIFGGAGLGATFAGTIRGLVPEVKPHERAGIFAAVYLVAYLSMGVSSIVAGIVATSIGVSAMSIDFGIAIAIASLIGVVTASGLINRRTPPPKVA
jgi:MFS family permease